MALNLLSALVMIRLGRVHEGLMVDVQAINAKLVGRSENILRRLSGRSEEELRDALQSAATTSRRRCSSGTGQRAFANRAAACRKTPLKSHPKCRRLTLISDPRCGRELSNTSVIHARFAIASNCISRSRSGSNSLSAIMLGPLDGA